MKKSFVRFLFLALLLSAVSLGAAAQERFLKPVDEGSSDTSFKLFRDKLIAAVKARDAKYVLSVVDPKIKNSFGDSDGVANFKKMWKIDSPQSELWDELLFILTHGGAFSREGASKTFMAPYVYSSFPEDLDAFEHSAIVGENVNLRATPFTTAPVVASLSYNLVKVDYNNSIRKKTDEDYEWLKVETLGGKSGFVQDRFVRSSVGYRAGFEKKRGQWKMTFLLAGD